MKTEIRKTTYTCDKCGKEIPDVVYFLHCYAETVGGYINVEAGSQNVRQNMQKICCATKHLCRECKNAITDGVFIV